MLVDKISAEYSAAYLVRRVHPDSSQIDPHMFLRNKSLGNDHCGWWAIKVGRYSVGR